MQASKIQIFEFAYSALSLFYSLFGYRTEETDCCDTGYVQFQFRFIHFVSLRKIQYTLFFYKNTFYKNIEAGICEILRIF